MAKTRAATAACPRASPSRAPGRIAARAQGSGCVVVVVRQRARRTRSAHGTWRASLRVRRAGDPACPSRRATRRTRAAFRGGRRRVRSGLGEIVHRRARRRHPLPDAGSGAGALWIGWPAATYTSRRQRRGLRHRLPSKISTRSARRAATSSKKHLAAAPTTTAPPSRRVLAYGLGRGAVRQRWPPPCSIGAAPRSGSASPPVRRQARHRAAPPAPRRTALELGGRQLLAPRRADDALDRGGAGIDACAALGKSVADAFDPRCEARASEARAEMGGEPRRGGGEIAAAARTNRVEIVVDGGRRRRPPRRRLATLRVHWRRSRRDTHPDIGANRARVCVRSPHV